MTIAASTIHAVYVHLAAELKAKGVPFEIVYGPTQVRRRSAPRASSSSTTTTPAIRTSARARR
jgi:hypothetical protein